MNDLNNKPKTRAQIIDELSKMLDQDKKTTRFFMETYEAFLILELTRAHEVKLGDIGKFKVSFRAERKGKNPLTGENVIIPAKTVPKFSFNKGVKEVINQDVFVSENDVTIDYVKDDEDLEDEFIDEYIEPKTK